MPVPFPLRCLLVLFFAVILYLAASLLPLKTIAAPEFITSLEPTYIIDQDGLASVTFSVSLTNLQAATFVKEYELSFSSTRLKNIVATTATGQPLSHTVTPTADQTIVRLAFDYPVVGKGKAQKFVLTFQDPDAAQLVGQVLTISVPDLPRSDAIDSSTVVILVPIAFGQPSVITPTTGQITRDEVYTRLEFTDPHRTGQALSVQFGDKQIYTYTLSYHLNNPTVTPIETQVALPPDTPYQRHYLDHLSTPPLQLKADADGNWIATYALEPKGVLDLTAQGKIITYLKPQVPVPFHNQNLKEYLLEQPYWPTTDSQVVDLVKTHSSPRQIYDYLVANFTYDYARIDNRSTQRLGAAQALAHPDQALCLEFTDTFITLSRAAGTPARLLTGFAYTQNPRLRPLSLVEDVLHAWPEYYDFSTSTWVPIDPTWGHTTGGVDYYTSLDLNHVVFAVQGLHSDQPYPAGYYKDPQSPGKDVQVDVSTLLPLKTTALSFSVARSALSSLGLPFSRPSLTISNRSNQAYYAQPVTLTSSSLTFNPNEIMVTSLLPFQTLAIPLSWQQQQPSRTHPLLVSFHDQEQSLVLTSFPLTSALIAAALTLACVCLGLILAFITRRLLVSRSSRHRPLSR